LRVTVILKAVSVGTEIDVEREGVPGVIAPDAYYLGGQDSLDQLIKLVVPDISW
jgi:hypothetical protein